MAFIRGREVRLGRAFPEEMGVYRQAVRAAGHLFTGTRNTRKRGQDLVAHAPVLCTTSAGKFKKP